MNAETEAKVRAMHDAIYAVADDRMAQGHSPFAAALFMSSLITSTLLAWLSSKAKDQLRAPDE